MKEIIIRRSIYDSSKEHKLVETDTEGEWLFVPAEDWMPVYLNSIGETIVSLDSDGFGNPLCLGDTVKYDNQVDKIVKKIYFKENAGYVIVLDDVKKS